MLLLLLLVGGAVAGREPDEYYSEHVMVRHDERARVDRIDAVFVFQRQCHVQPQQTQGSVVTRATCLERHLNVMCCHA